MKSASLSALRLIVPLLLLTSPTLPMFGASTRCVSEALVAVLELHGVSGVVDEIANQSLATPAVASRWYYDRQSSPRPCWAEDRLMFREMVTSVETLRGNIARMSSDELRVLVNTLSDLADWVGAREGYGNLLLEVRLRALLAQAVGQALLKPAGEVLEWAEAAIDATIPRLGSSSCRARILNGEAQKPVVRTPISDEDLRLFWTAREAENHLDGLPEASRMVVPPGGASDQKLRSLGYGDNAAQPDRFFKDDICAESTTIGCWEKKQHHRIAYVGSPRKEFLGNLLEYRRVVGFVPELASKGSEDSLAVLQRFSDSWQAHVGLGQRTEVASGAWLAWKGIQSGYFDDPEYGSRTGAGDGG